MGKESYDEHLKKKKAIYLEKFPDQLAVTYKVACG